MASLSSSTSWAEGDPLTPNHLNSKMDPVIANVAAINSEVGGWVVRASNYSGNWDDKIRSAISDLGAFGGIVDATGLTGSQVMGSSLTIATKGVTVLLGPMTLTMGSHRIFIGAGCHSVQLKGASPYGTLPALGFNGSTFLYYTGNSTAISIGTTTGTRTRDIVLEDLGVHCTDAGASAIGVGMYDTIVSEINRLYIPCGIGKVGQTCLKIDGTGGACFNILVRNPSFTGGGTGIHFTGTGTAAANANSVLGGTYSSSTTIASVGLRFDADSNGNAVQGMDLENCSTAILMSNTARYNFVFGRFESNGTDFGAASTSTGNLIFGYGNTALQGILAQGTAIQPSFAMASEQSLGWYRSGTSTMALSYGTLNLNQGRLVSVRTQASLASTGNIVNNEWAVVVGVSAATLAIRSGNTTYLWVSSATTNV